MNDSINDKVPDLMERLGISGRQLQNVKLGPGVVGRNSSIAWALEIVMLAGVICGGWLHSPTLVGISLFGAVAVALVVALGNIHFGKKNPAAALLEGAHFLEFQQMQMTASKGGSLPELPGPPVPQPLELTDSEEPEL